MKQAILGKKGETVKRLIEKTKAQIHIPKAGTGPNSSERVIQIKGTPEQIEEVKREIAMLTSSSTFGGRSANMSAANFLKEQQQQAVAAISMYLPQYCKNFVIT